MRFSGKAGPGRPKGSQDKKYLSLKFWFDKLETELAKKITITRKTKDGLYVDSWQTSAVSPDKRAQIFLEAMKMLTSKVKNLPVSQEESVSNAVEAQEILNRLEGGTEKGSDSVSLPPPVVPGKTFPTTGSTQDPR